MMFMIIESDGVFEHRNCHGIKIKRRRTPFFSYAKKQNAQKLFVSRHS